MRTTTIIKLLAVLRNKAKKLNRYELIPLLLILGWCIPYFTTGNKIELGDFSYFAQGYEAIRINILEYHQFPWWNPWVSGGVPLYGNPQLGVFSIDTLLTLILGPIPGLKMAMVLYTLAGYASMQLLLRRYFKVDSLIASLSGLAWVTCSFFVAHLPPHYSFAWYMLAPLFIYLSLKLSSIKGALLLGGSFAIMALSQIHNPFFHILLICGAILLFRLVKGIGKISRVRFLGLLVVSACTFILIAGHRLFFTAQNALDFPRHVGDPKLPIFDSLKGLVLPFSRRYDLGITYPKYEYGWGEITGSIGLFGIILLLSLVTIYFSRHRLFNFAKKQRYIIVGLVVLLVTTVTIGLGEIGSLSPYSLIKKLPVYEGMRVSSRWFIFAILLELIIISILITKLNMQRLKKAFTVGLSLVVLELFILNFGYQYKTLNHTPLTSSQPTKSQQFEQSILFGDTINLHQLTSNSEQAGKPSFYREYEATTFNIGVLKANDTLVELKPEISPRCSFAKGCGLVLTDNASVESWSPGKIVLKRTGAGPIEMNMNNSSYFLVNGVRNPGLRVAEPYQKFIIEGFEDSKYITIQVKPAIITPVLKKIESKL